MIKIFFPTVPLLILALSLFVLFSPVMAQEQGLEQAAVRQENIEARVIQVLEQKQLPLEYSQEPGLYQKLELKVTKGSLKGKTITVESGNLPVANLQQYHQGDRVVVTLSQAPDGSEVYYISDYVRRVPLFWLFSIFVVVVTLIARWRGLASLVGMAASFVVIFKFIVPQILSGSDPVLIAILGSLVIIPLTFYLSHGISRKTTVAVAGTLVSLVITGVLALFFVEQAKLTGFASEEAGFLQVAKQGIVNIKGLLLAGIIIGVLGVLDDITVSQSAIVIQLKKANSKLGFGKLYQQAMDVGRDHIASMVNTLVLVYAGAALPLFLLFINNPHPFSEIISYELVADEVVRTLVGSIGLVLAVPITTLIAALVVERTD